MHEKWQELIPFYVAKTLPSNQVQALENHLAACGPCRQAVDEWRRIANVTWQSANTWSQQLPPLSQAVRDQVRQRHEATVPSEPVSVEQTAKSPVLQMPQQQPRHVDFNVPTRPNSSRPPQKRDGDPRRLPVMASAAAVLVLVIFGGLIVYWMSQANVESEPLRVQQLTPVALGRPPANLDPGDAFAGQPAGGDDHDMGIISTPQGIPSPTNTLIPTPNPAANGSSQAEAALPPNSGGGGIMPSPGVCMVSNTTDAPINIYSYPQKEALPTGVMQPGESRRVLVTDGFGWYEVFRSTGGIEGWVSLENVVLSGDCTQLMLPSPTPTGGPVVGSMVCTAVSVNDSAVNIYPRPEAIGDPINAFGPGEMVGVQAKSTNNWYRIMFDIYGTVWSGWANGNLLEIRGNCQDLPLLDAGQIAPEITPVPSPTYVRPAPTIVNFTADNNVLRAASLITIQWETQNAASVTISRYAYEGDPNTISLAVASAGSTTFTTADIDPDVSELLFTMEVYGFAGEYLTETISVTILHEDDNSTDEPAAPPSGNESETDNGRIQSGSWSHQTTVMSHACGGEVGSMSTITLTLMASDDESSITITYEASGTTFTLDRTTGQTYSGSYGTASTVEVTLTFTSPTTYTASETVTHETGCVVELSWAGTADTQ